MSVDLKTSYLGFELLNPLVPSASPLTSNLDTLRRLEEAGAAAVVLPSLFEEQIEHEAMEMQRVVEYGAQSFAESLSGYFPDMEDYATKTKSYLRHAEQAAAALAIPVIGSLNGTTTGGWVRYARWLAEAGVDALELNVYLIPTDAGATGEDVENRYTELVAAVRQEVSLPLAVKIGPYFSSPAHMAQRLTEAGADALVLFNRFYQPDIDLEGLEVVPDLQLSTSVELRLPLRWVAILRGQVDVDLAVTTGAHTGADVLKALLVGADAVQMASALLRRGPEHLESILEEMRVWLFAHEYESVRQMKGSMSLANAANPEEFVRANYMRMLVTYSAWEIGSSLGPTGGDSLRR